MEAITITALHVKAFRHDKITKFNFERKFITALRTQQESSQTSPTSVISNNTSENGTAGLDGVGICEPGLWCSESQTWTDSKNNANILTNSPICKAFLRQTLYNGMELLKEAQWPGKGTLPTKEVSPLIIHSSFFHSVLALVKKTAFLLYSTRYLSGAINPLRIQKLFYELTIFSIISFENLP